MEGNDSPLIHGNVVQFNFDVDKLANTFGFITIPEALSWGAKGLNFQISPWKLDLVQHMCAKAELFMPALSQKMTYILNLKIFNYLILFDLYARKSSCLFAR